jgi:hypothetical protein
MGKNRLSECGVVIGCCRAGIAGDLSLLIGGEAAMWGEQVIIITITSFIHHGPRRKKKSTTHVRKGGLYMDIPV